MKQILDTIHSPEDIRKLSESDSKKLCGEIRSFLVNSISETGGHLSSNLGVVELTVALHQSFHAPKDKIVWDVGHQAYVHKILTGRKDRFPTLRRENGLSGFPKTSESDYDTFNTGHASNSISVAYGMAKARDLSGQDYHVVCVIGDGSLTGGMAFEAMNNAGHDKTGLIVVLNDNKMSIDRSVGSLSSHLARLRTGSPYLKSKRRMKSALSRYPALKPLYNAADYIKDRLKYLFTKGILFEEMGFTYLGPINGHDIGAMREVFEEAKVLKEPVLIHVITKKGKGYEPAEKEPERFHGIGKFSTESGESLDQRKLLTYSEVFGKELNEIGKNDPSVVLVTAAMSEGTGAAECTDMEDRVYDVGIAEEHAISFASGLARGGMIPYVAIYSTFLQRAYDQIMEDLCLQDVPVKLILDHGGIVGEDGETHQGIYDLAYLSSMPNMTIAAPSCMEDLKNMVRESRNFNHPLAIRYPKGAAWSSPEYPLQDTRWGKGIVLRDLKAAEAPEHRARVAVLALGACLQASGQAAEELIRHSCDVMTVDVRFAFPLDEEMLEKVFRSSDLVVTVEEGVEQGGYGAAVSLWKEKHHAGKDLLVLALPNRFIPQGTRTQLLKNYGLDAASIEKSILNFLKKSDETMQK